MFRVNSVCKDAHTVPPDCFISTENCSRSPFDIFPTLYSSLHKSAESIFSIVSLQEFLYFLSPAGPWNALVHTTTNVPVCGTAVFDALHPHTAGQTLLLLGWPLMKFTTFNNSTHGFFLPSAVECLVRPSSVQQQNSHAAEVRGVHKHENILALNDINLTDIAWLETLLGRLMTWLDLRHDDSNIYFII